MEKMGPDADEFFFVLVVLFTVLEERNKQIKFSNFQA